MRFVGGGMSKTIVKDKKTIAIGIVADRYIDKKYYEYMFSLINLQTIKDDVKIFIALVHNDGINIVEIVDLINIVGFPYENVRIKYNRDRVEMIGNIEWIKNESKADYLILLKNNDAFFETNSLELCISNASNEYQQICVIRENGDYIRSEEEKVVFIRRGLSFFNRFKRKTNNSKIVLRRIEENEDIDKASEVLTSFIEGNMLNYSDFVVYNKIKDNKKKSKEEAQMIRNNSAHSMWGITDSKKYLLYLLENNIKETPRSYEKIKLLFLTMEYSCFPSIQKIVDFALNDDRFEVDLVYVPFYHSNKARPDEEEIEAYKKRGYNIIRHSEYDLTHRSPDVSFIIKPYDSVPREYYVSEIYRVVDKIIFVKYCPDAINVKDSESFDKYFYRSSLNYIAWKNYLSSKKIYENRTTKAWKDTGDNWIFETNPRCDMDVLTVKKDFPDETERIISLSRNRKIIFWNTQHFITGENHIGTFLEMGEAMLDCITKNRNLFFVWRPHPLFWGALAHAKGDEYVSEIKKRIENEENIIIDEADSYLPAFYLSDAMISDMSSLVGEYMMTKNPICFLYTKMEKSLYPEEYLNCLYVTKGAEDFDRFLEMMNRNGDEMKEIRLEVIDKNFKINNDKKTISEKILDDIYMSLSM